MIKGENFAQKKISKNQKNLGNTVYKANLQRLTAKIVTRKVSLSTLKV